MPRAFRRSANKFPRESFSNKCATNVLAIDQEDSAQAVVGAPTPRFRGVEANEAMTFAISADRVPIRYFDVWRNNRFRLH